jgi:hypothetical protein
MPELININLNQFYLSKGGKANIPSVKDPQYLDKALKSLKMITYGGYGEDRSDIWAGTYLQATQAFTHLGCDINVPHKTKVYFPFSAEIIDIHTDVDTQLGWGGRVILRKSKGSPYIILCHLDPHTLIDTKKKYASQYIGQVGTWPTNGNTFEHLHVQLRYTDDFESMDGYGYKKDLLNNPCPFTTKI